MTSTLFKMIYLSKKERDVLTPHELLIVVLHELNHIRSWYSPILTRKQRQKAESIVQRKTTKQMLELGYTKEQLLAWEFNSRLMDKYNLTRKEYEEFMFQIPNYK